MMRQKHTHSSKNRKLHNHTESVDYHISTATTSSEYAGFVDPILDGSAIFDELSQKSLFWLDDTDTTRNRINGDEVPMASIQHISGNITSTDPYPNALDKLSTGMTDFLGNPSSEDRSMDRSGKHRCWDHGCNGREFSSKSNFVRHVKERSGASTKGVCPLCGAIFTRNSARDTHLAKQSCNRIRRYSNGRPRPSRLAVLGNPRLAAAAVAATQDIHWQAVDWGAGPMDDASQGLAPPN
ncbi:uncharacterized protein F4822DRAFT_143406 [Hypoxylon trugodes]|uniref:uncharacterized protein n=1 Tax=Hypoxylon trugodes TaxID=326681 RepID=UPI002196E6C2|nr:uncharacterized protein F4822DRAFT_143406 [Hypoxylon trugodes]KAI1392856.1 hypothetical protein F4822DRAFT_143406 [Hypoxylon trugodes]